MPMVLLMISILNWHDWIMLLKYVFCPNSKK